MANLASYVLAHELDQQCVQLVSLSDMAAFCQHQTFPKFHNQVVCYW